MSLCRPPRSPVSFSVCQPLQDMNPGYASALLGITNTAGALPGILGVSAVGFLLEKTSSWSMALFLPIAGCYLFGLIIFSIFANSERQEFN